MTFIIRRYTVDSGGINFTARDDILSEKITLAVVVASPSPFPVFAIRRRMRVVDVWDV